LAGTLVRGTTATHIPNQQFLSELL
jgi:hypothetical protein